MHIADAPLRCLACQHCWVGETVNDAPLQVVLGSWKAMRCPVCNAGWRKLAFRTEPEASHDP